MIIKQLQKLGAPANFYHTCNKLLPWTAATSLLLLALGLWGGLINAPEDYQQGQAFRIIYIHVPSAFMSLGIYVAMALFASIFLIWRIKVADMLALSCAPIGAIMTLNALVTGAIWGKPMWGTWWQWDARLTSELILLFLFLGYIALRNAYHDTTTAGKISALLALVGTINIPIIHYSVEWWFTLHQGSTISQAIFKGEKPTMPWPMLWPLLTMVVTFALIAITTVLLRARNEVLSRERQSRWRQELNTKN